MHTIYRYLVLNNSYNREKKKISMDLVKRQNIFFNANNKELYILHFSLSSTIQLLEALVYE